MDNHDPLLQIGLLSIGDDPTESLRFTPKIQEGKEDNPKNTLWDVFLYFYPTFNRIFEIYHRESLQDTPTKIPGKFKVVNSILQKIKPDDKFIDTSQEVLERPLTKAKREFFSSWTITDDQAFFKPSAYPPHFTQGRLSFVGRDPLSKAPEPEQTLLLFHIDLEALGD